MKFQRHFIGFLATIACHFSFFSLCFADVFQVIPWHFITISWRLNVISSLLWKLFCGILLAFHWLFSDNLTTISCHFSVFDWCFADVFPAISWHFMTVSWHFNVISRLFYGISWAFFTGFIAQIWRQFCDIFLSLTGVLLMFSMQFHHISTLFLSYFTFFFHFVGVSLVF